VSTFNPSVFIEIARLSGEKIVVEGEGLGVRSLGKLDFSSSTLRCQESRDIEALPDVGLGSHDAG